LNLYEQKARYELKQWQKRMSRRPSIINRITKGMQTGVNNLIPDRIHRVITSTIKNMVRVVLVGSELTAKQPLTMTSLEDREYLVIKRLEFYKKAATASGAGTGSGGILLGLADFPILLSIKIKFLFDAASLYGFDVNDYKERLYILYIFQLAFSSEARRFEVYKIVKDWEAYVGKLPYDLDSFDWRTFQQEYRDYIDLAKMLQLVPGIGAIVGAYANYRLIGKLGETAMNAYRMRVLDT
jgi:hypothetical protein